MEETYEMLELSDTELAQVTGGYRRDWGDDDWDDDDGWYWDYDEYGRHRRRHRHHRRHRW